MRRIYTIGHSSHPRERFSALLKEHSIEVLVDTRSSPYSKFSPQFDREALRELVAPTGVRYLYLGDAVGGRPRDEMDYDDRGRARYARMSTNAEFLGGIARLERGADEFRVALLCSEEDPTHCHRRLLVGRVLVERGAEMLHIRGDGSVHDESRIVKESGKPLAEMQPALFAEMEEDKWRSTASVSRKGRRQSSSAF